MTVTSYLGNDIVSAIQSVVGKDGAQLHEPSFNGNEWAYIKECLDSNYVSSVGKFVDRFEADLAEYTGAKFAVAVVNGTAALHIALKLAGVFHNDEVLVPALTFVATANAVTYCNAIPHFVDSEESTFGIDAAKLRSYLKDLTEQRSGQCINKVTGRVIRALILMHVFGHPSDIDGLLAVASDFNIKIVEDAAESLGSYYHEHQTGTFGLLGTLSFNGNKTITTGGGGALLTSNSELAAHAKRLTTTSKLPHPWAYRHDEIAYNYRLPNLNAALGCAQLEQMPSKLAAKRELFKRYKQAFSGIRGAALVAEPINCQSNFWLQTLLLDPKFESQLDEILMLTNNAGLMTRPAWVLMSELEQFKLFPKMDLTMALSLSRRLLNIPSSPQIVWGAQNG